MGFRSKGSKDMGFRSKGSKDMGWHTESHRVRSVVKGNISTHECKIIKKLYKVKIYLFIFIYNKYYFIHYIINTRLLKISNIIIMHIYVLKLKLLNLKILFEKVHLN